jgi:hypothetical protein
MNLPVIRIILLLSLLLFFIVVDSFAQKVGNEELEEILEDISKETDYSPELDAFEYLSDNPIILKTTTADKLSQIPGISYNTAIKIIDLVQVAGINSYEILSDSLSLTYEQRNILRKCTRFEKEYPNEFKDQFTWRVRNQQSLNKIRGFEDSSFVGTPLTLYQRINLNHDKFSAGILTTKEAGERLLADFYSGYFGYKSEKFNLVLGDYYIESGLGNLLSKSFGLRKGPDVISSVIRLGGGVQPYRSSLENNYFRGAAVQINWGNKDNYEYKADLWISSSTRAATVDTINNVVSSIFASGMFRTQSEIDKKNKLQEQAIGTSFEISKSIIKVGITGLYLNYDRKIETPAKTAFSGKSGLLSTIYSTVNFKNASIGAELSRDALGNAGFKAAIQNETKLYDVSFLYRNFSSDFRSPFGYSFGESSSPANEVGFYSALRWKGIQNIILSTYLDIYKTHTKTYTVPLPVKGIDLFVQSEWLVNSHLNLILRLKYEDKTDALTLDNNSKIVYQQKKVGMRFEITDHVKSNLMLRFRLEGDYIDFENYQPHEIGLAGFGELIYKPYEFLETGGRISYFSTDSYASAIWQYEYTLPGYMTTSALYGDGTRTYLYIRFKPVEWLSLWARYAVTAKNNLDYIGSGVDEILDNSKKVLYFQMDVRM